jgi:hypothetical protein
LIRPNKLPCTVPATENRVRVSTPEKRAVGRERQQILADASRSASRYFPCAN